ncbi:MAG: hypothetical protein CTY15_01510 [Methylocystis sp.]|nr:MAG: hypothetical protein CTY15_01510 [Methylocystis sp.]
MAESETTEPSRCRAAFVLVPGSGRSPPGRDESRSLAQVTFDRRELNMLFNLYGAKVAAGEWRDYALDFTPARAVFSIFRRSSEAPLYRVEKNPELSRRRGAYAVIAAGGLIMRRGHDLSRVLRVLDGFRVVGKD